MPFEFAYLNFIQENLRSKFMDQLMIHITYFGEYGLFWVLVALGLLFYKSTRKYGVILVIALILDIICINGIIKPLFQRIRPCYIHPIALLIEAPHGYSFPSGHAGACFAAAFALLFAKHKFWSAAMLLAVLVGFSRNYLYVHYPTDVLGGMVIGLFSGYLANYMYERNYLPVFITNMLR